MREADGALDEEEGQGRERQQPVKDLARVGGLADEGEETKSQLDDDANDWATLLVDIGELLGGHATLGHGLHSTGAAKGARVGHGDDGDGDDPVHDVGEDADTGIFDGEHKGRSCATGVLSASSHHNPFFYPQGPNV